MLSHESTFGYTEATLGESLEGTHRVLPLHGLTLYPGLNDQDPSIIGGEC